MVVVHVVHGGACCYMLLFVVACCTRCTLCSRGVTSDTDPTIQMQARLHGIVQDIELYTMHAIL